MKRIASIVLIFIFIVGCVDRVMFDIPLPPAYGISISGYISDQPGPYEVLIYKAFDTQSDESPRTGINVKDIIMFDSEGHQAKLELGVEGKYRTKVNDIRGKIGNAYWIRVELFDGRVYESLPDTLYAGATLDRVETRLVSKENFDGTLNTTIDVYANSSFNNTNDHGRYIWTMTNTFQSLTWPEDEQFNCYMIDGFCNGKDPCTGLRRVGIGPTANLVRVHDCECCTCWYQESNDQVVINDENLRGVTSINDLQIERIPVSFFRLQYKMHISVQIRSLSTRAYQFWRSVRDQQSAINNIFQPVTGQIHGNFEQITGREVRAYGMFYATSFDSGSKYFYRSDIPVDLIPKIDREKGAGAFSCLKLFPNASTQPPDWWESSE